MRAWRPEFRLLKTVPRIGDTLATSITLEFGSIGRFAQVGKCSSYCRCVDSLRESDGKRKGEGNTRNGNKYLGWTFVEASAQLIAITTGSLCQARILSAFPHGLDRTRHHSGCWRQGVTPGLAAIHR
jgi:transposase